jgi:hypothetical protein
MYKHQQDAACRRCAVASKLMRHVQSPGVVTSCISGTRRRALTLTVRLDAMFATSAAAVGFTMVRACEKPRLIGECDHSIDNCWQSWHSPPSMARMVTSFNDSSGVCAFQSSSTEFLNPSSTKLSRLHMASRRSSLISL